MTIRQIEELTYEEALKIATETMEIKGHQCIFAELGDTFGYSILIFKDRHHIYYANDYELHHGYLVKESGKEALRDYYINEMNNKLYTDEELLEDIKTYYEYNKKQYFLRNYWIMRYDYVSIFAISKEDQEKVKKGKKTHPYFNPVSFCYVKDGSIVDTSVKYLNHLENEFKKLKANNEIFREMVSYELANHEACITGRYEESLDALGMSFEKLTEEQQIIVLEELKKQEDRYYI